MEIQGYVLRYRFTQRMRLSLSRRVEMLRFV